MIIGFILNFTQTKIPVFVTNYLDIVGSPTILLLMLSLGIYFEIKAGNFKRIFLVILIRIGLGSVLGLLITGIFGFTGDIRAIILISFAAPVGYNTLIFSSLESLDKELAADLVSISILMGLVYVPLLIYLLNN